MTKLNLPTKLHKAAIEIVRDFFLKQDHVDTILLTNSCARGKAIPESDIDFAILIKQALPRKEVRILEDRWHHFLHTEPTLVKYKNSHHFAQIHLDIIKGIYKPVTWEAGEGPDFFEVEIGNHLVYSQPLAGKGEYFNQLQRKWLPYYDTTIQSVRLKMVNDACRYDLDHIPFFIKRGMYFHAFDRLYKAFQEFLQALFIRYKTYPIAYNKWIKEQLNEVLILPELYKKLPRIISVNNIESDKLNAKGADLKKLLEEYC